MKSSWSTLGKQGILFALLLACASCSSTPKPPPSVETTSTSSADPSRALTITLGSSDQVSIRVWQNSDLDRSVTVDPSGSIDFPLIGPMKVLGMTVEELKKQLTEKLARYIVDPKVEVNVLTLSSQTIHLLGEVENAGPITLVKNIYPWEAISAAGGFTADANQKKVLLIRIENDKPVVTAMDLNTKSMAKSGSYENLAYLRSGDIVYVPRTKLGDLEAFMNHIKTLVSPIVTVEQAIVLAPQAADALTGEDSANNSVIIPTITP